MEGVVGCLSGTLFRCDAIRPKNSMQVFDPFADVSVAYLGECVDNWLMSSFHHPIRLRVIGRNNDAVNSKSSHCLLHKILVLWTTINNHSSKAAMAADDILPQELGNFLRACAGDRSRLRPSAYILSRHHKVLLPER